MRRRQKLRETEIKSRKIIRLGTKVWNPCFRAQRCCLFISRNDQSWFLQALSDADFDKNIPAFLSPSEDRDDDICSIDGLPDKPRKGSPR